MPRYFFDLTDDESLSLVDDEVGENFDRVEAARGLLWQWPGNCRATDCPTPSLGFTSRSLMSAAS
jgi:hypothetical protein